MAETNSNTCNVNNNKETAKPSTVFSDLRGDAIETGDLGVTEIESMCPKCFENGTTRLLLTRIPFFRDVVISSFDCPHCFYKNNEVTNASAIQETGVKYTFKMNERRDLHRNVMRSEYCSVIIPEIDLEIPTLKTNKGIFTTVEGLLERAFEDIERDQPLRRIENPEIADQIDAFLTKGRTLTGVINETQIPNVTIIFQDHSGNSHVENPHAPFPDPRLRVDYYARTKDMAAEIGYHDAVEEEEEEAAAVAYVPEAHGGLDLEGEVLSIGTNCPSCGAAAQANFKTVAIPFFKDVIIMATVCDQCGYKSNEVKSGCGFEEKARRLELSVSGAGKQGDEFEHKIDMARDVLKSETCGIAVPELDFEIGRGAIEGKFTTIEGLFGDIKRVVEKNPFTTGDSAMVKAKENVVKFCDKVDAILAGQMAVTLILDDPAGNSYIQNPQAPEDDPKLKIVDYERTFEQKEELGLNQMNTEDYETVFDKNKLGEIDEESDSAIEEAIKNSLSEQ